MIPPDERFRITTVAAAHGIDWRLLAALRETENGRAGSEFGVMIPGTDTWDEEANAAARTIRRTLGRYWAGMHRDWWDESARRYTDAFLAYLSWGGEGYPGYAPRGAANDPTDLNANHYPNLRDHYAHWCGGGDA